MTENKPDLVNHPAHYTMGGIECIDAIRASMSEEQYRGYLKGNALKYIWRYEHKGHPAQDLRKAQWYLGKLADILEEQASESDQDVESAKERYLLGLPRSSGKLYCETGKVTRMWAKGEKGDAE